MTYQQVSLELLRDGQCTPFGFRMTGGADIGTPLIVQKVTFGSPSEGELQRGDIILRIRDTDATRLSHKGATDLISKAGSTLKIVVARNASGMQIPASPTPQLSTMPSGGNPFIYKPLPTTNFAAQRQRRSSVESFTSTTSSDTEKEAIINQPYRSIPLILPGAKVTKDIPVGSYLRFDPLSRSSTSSPSSYDSRLGDPYMLNKVQQAIMEAAQTSSGASSPGRTPTPDFINQNGIPVYLKQYNTPINMYSNQAIVEALAAQSVSSRTPPLNNADMLENKKLTNITQSPTYQMIHDEEWKRGKVEEHGPLEEHVYNVVPHGGNSYRHEIHQSESFKSIMHDLKGISDM
ncbi:PDZ and LIM domain protein 3-like [Parasteatoda tepidariorum]|uniref:PDZ and LIM domain protein 3-like n=1 Tax=Parasteatoda tepidariorum TaxID=114398 RepID=UPI0039BCC776